MSLPAGWLSKANIAVVNHLKDHYMAGAPHINTLGPVQFIELDEEPEDEDQDDASLKNYSEDPQWKFTPNKAAYQLRVKPFKYEPIKTSASFYIRLNEGCIDDVKNDLISLEDLEKSFLKVDFVVNQFPDFADPEVVVYENEDIITDKVSVSVNTQEHEQKIELEYSRESDIFMTFISGTPNPIKQKYVVKLIKKLEKIEDYYTIDVSLSNLSPVTIMSSIISKADSEDLEEYQSKLYFDEERAINPKGNRYGYLMEYELRETLNSEINPFDEKTASKTVNVIMSGDPKIGDLFEGELIFRDYALFTEEVPKMTSGSKISDFFKENNFSPLLSDVLTKDKHYSNLHLFQETAMKRITENIRRDGKNVTMLSARTGGGKTEAFVLPILNYCIENSTFGTKALIFYPTKALANSQANRIINLLYYLNKRLNDRKITLGLLHGDIPTRERDIDRYQYRRLPLECPICEDGRLELTESDILKCNSCGEFIDYVKIRTRTDVYSSPPDIVITNPDTLIWDIMMRPQNHSILGRPVFVCKNCGQTYIPIKTKRVCDSCHSRDITEIYPTVPKFAVFDEIHIAKGTYGINTSLFLSRLEAILAKYSSEYHGSDHNLIKIGSTATIANAKYFGKTFFNVAEEEVVLVPKDEFEQNSFYEKGIDENIKRHHLFIMPYLYTSISTIGRVINFLESSTKGLDKYGVSLEPLEDYLRILTFVNSIRSSNSLINATKRTVGIDNPNLPDKIGGHTTDFDNESRAKIETDFNKGELSVIFATSTLEVGVDFDRIDAIIINGFPYSFNDYLQRIGRAGRRTDSLIISVCQEWKPVDHYYFINGKTMLNQPQTHSEPVPITRDNVSAITKHALGCTFDYIMSLPEAENYVNGYKSFQDILSHQSNIKDYIDKALDIPNPYKQEITDQLEEFLEFIRDDSSSIIYNEKTMIAFSKNINSDYQLTNLRGTEKDVPVEIWWSL